VFVNGGGGTNLSKTPYVSLIQGIIRRERLCLPMRRLTLILLSCLIVAPAALASARATGDGVLELRTVNGAVVLTGKGVVWGQMDKGRLVVNDLVQGDGDPLVSGWERKVVGTATCDTCVVYSGKDLHFRITGGKYKLSFIQASGIDLSAVGVGSAQLTGDWLADDTGDWALDGGKWTPVPWQKRTVTFGVQPPAPPAVP
jgi:hypothetical protein